MRFMICRLANMTLKGLYKMTTVITSAIADTRLTDLEATIEKGIEHFVKVGEALLTIRNEGLYKPHYATFQAYIKTRWNMNHSYAYQLMGSVDVVHNVGEGELKNAYQARQLIPLEPEEQRIVWEVVKKTSPTKHVSGTHIKAVVEVFKSVMVTGAIDGGEGDDIAVSDILKATITEATFERMQRQKLHLQEKLGDKPRTFTCANCGHIHTF